MLSWLLFAAQLQLTIAPRRDAAGDSLADLARARDAQAGFERGRRYLLPWESGGGGRCDVRIGRFCWWYEPSTGAAREEPGEIGSRRLELVALLDTLAVRHPGDGWLAGMRLHYRIDGGRAASADSAARACAADGWWCAALRGYAAHAAGDARRAAAEFATALAAMPDSTRCAWADIAPLLPDDRRAEYSRRSCAEREPLATRYWLLAAPRLSAGANEWRSEWLARHVDAALLASAVTPHRLRWGPDLEELLLRYGWPVAWSRIIPASPVTLEPEILGHDPSPSFDYGPRAELLDSGAAGGPEGWALDDPHGAFRVALRGVRWMSAAATQVARFRRGDSTALVAAWATADDSLPRPEVTIAAAEDGAAPWRSRTDSGRVGRATLMLAGTPLLAAVELADSTTGGLARVRRVYAPAARRAGEEISDLLLYRPAADTPPTLADAAALAIPGDTVHADAPLGLYWESYAAAVADTARDTWVLVERIDQGVFRSMRQRLGLLDPDSPLRIRWTEPRAPHDGIATRALSMDLRELPAGRYRVTVGLGAGGPLATTATTEITLLGP